MWIVIVASLAISAYGATLEPSCTLNGVYTELATACENSVPTTICENYFPATPAGTDTRPEACYLATGGTEPDKAVVDFATKNCAKTCGFCCLTPAYNCPNKPLYLSRWDCSKVTKAQCDSPALKQSLAEDCPATCGLCLEGGCVDNAPDCAADIRICMTWPDFAKNECKRTCGYCGTSSGSPPPPPPPPPPPAPAPAPSAPCADKSSSCASWAKNNYCSNTWYTFEDRKQTCGKTCGFC